jgi:hypothetical protein
MVPEISPCWDTVLGSEVHGSVCGTEVGDVGYDGGYCCEDWDRTCGEFVEGVGCANCLSGGAEVGLEEGVVLCDTDVGGLELAEDEEGTFVGVYELLEMNDVSRGGTYLSRRWLELSCLLQRDSQEWSSRQRMAENYSD